MKKSQGFCRTTHTERFENPECCCETYKDNLGPCASHVLGMSGRCAYCDHEMVCKPKEIEDEMAKTPICLVIACDELAERKAKCVEHLRERGVRAIFLRGVYGLGWGLRTVKQFDPGQSISSGHVALNLNHFMCWQILDTMLQNSDDYGIVFEDDVVLPDNFADEVFKVYKELFRLMPHWDLIFLGSGDAGVRTWGKVTERIGGPDSRYCRQQDPWGTHALMIRKKAIPTLSRLMAIAERNMDQQLYQRVLKDNHLEWCMVLPSLVQQRTYDHKGVGKPEWKPSTIENPKEKDEPQPQAVSPEQYAGTMKMIDPYECTYRGEFLEEVGEGDEISLTELTGRKKSVVLSECARLGAPCHIRADVVDVTLDEQEVANCATCEIRGKRSYNTNVVKLPIPDGHFNPSMCFYRGEVIVATRDSWGHSALGLWRLNNSVKHDWSGEWSVEPIGSFRSSHSDAGRLEDPRLYLKDGRLYASLNLPDGYPPKYVKVGTVRFEEDLSGIDQTRIYDSPHGCAYEKNWVRFAFEGKDRWVYGIKPEHTILNEDGDVIHKTDNKLPWMGGALRGGATPIFVNGKWWSFVHGCLKVTKGNVYSVGCVTFDPNPPHRVLRQAAIPLVWPEAYHDPNVNVVKRNVMWPGGAIFYRDHFWVILGIDDTYCAMCRLSFEEVERALTDIPETNSVVSIRETPVSLGVLAKERQV